MEKLNLVKEGKDLRIYFLEALDPMDLGSYFILDYSLEGVIFRLQGTTPLNNSRVRGSVPVRRIFDQVQFSEEIPPKVAEPPADVAPSPPKTSREQFMYNLMLTRDQFITEDKDKKALARIISKYEKSKTNS